MTWADVVALAPALASLAVARQTQILAEVDNEVSTDAWGDYAEAGKRYLAAHKGTVTVLSDAGSGGGAALGPITSESLGPMSRSYGTIGDSTSVDAELSRTSYGREYIRLRSLAVGFAAAVY